ncbi:MAG: potassium channel family protein [Vulcanimicrobiota bacterium]
MAKHTYGKILYNESPRSAVKTIAKRFLILILVITITGVIFYLDRHGLRDSVNPDKPVGLTEVFYFTIVTITTLGYGDIVPVTPFARLFDAIFVTLVRLFTYFIVLSTAMEFTFQKIMEGYMIKKLIKRTKNHTIICGFGRVGREILNLLLENGEDPEQIVVVDTAEEQTTWAAEMGVAALRGNAENEDILTMADIRNAHRIYLCSNQDHTNLMVCLTARSMSEDVEIIAVAREKENVKLFKKGGADKVINLPGLLSEEMIKELEKEEDVVQPVINDQPEKKETPEDREPTDNNTTME